MLGRQLGHGSWSMRLTSSETIGVLALVMTVDPGWSVLPDSDRKCHVPVCPGLQRCIDMVV
jgi:hypothetical protein